MKLLHVSYHKGCINDFSIVAEKLGIEHEHFKGFDSPCYNMGKDIANDIYNRHKEYFDSFDIILTSDTAPLARIFLQNNFNRLVIWICNRFDYGDRSTNTCGFPDVAYYDLFREANTLSNVDIISYTDFEHIYANSKGVPISNFTIKPIGHNLFGEDTIQNRENLFFISQYHNDNLFMNLTQKCEGIGIKCYHGTHIGPNDLKGFKGIIHIPYAWSNLALFENLHNGLVYFLPSKEFLLRLSKGHNFWWQDVGFLDSHIESSEWYHKDYRECFVYFDSWEDLRNKVQNTDYIAKKKVIADTAQWHIDNYMNAWKDILIKGE